MDTQLCFPKKQDKVKKRVIWDIEVAEELQWKGWVLGIILPGKNVPNVFTFL